MTSATAPLTWAMGIIIGAVSGNNRAIPHAARAVVLAPKTINFSDVSAPLFAFTSAMC